CAAWDDSLSGYSF
nr:immunoglobulin light chain junction region [Macaca mulatta]MPO05476.1 immunoglobulin light chain junction region [Macaca mulatta]MPO06283.1 immunoglobulin light chain junction region [Macaca mulatta]MPO07744.1 immunoglobulin light chain junction region [Macaca mulatta]MPO09742.1 immunoglobulin light chain junction region [Macaca mulatta]